jgi:hypothetical protein
MNPGTPRSHANIYFIGDASSRAIERTPLQQVQGHYSSTPISGSSDTMVICVIFFALQEG